jgi:hypothetical protein
LDAVSFWILPLLVDHKPILLDSWTILSLGLNLHRYAHEQGVEAALDARLVDAISSYSEIDEIIVERVRSLVRGSGTDGLLLVNSTKSSGRLTRRVRQICQNLNYTLKVVSLFSAAEGREEGEEVLCTLPTEFRRYSPAECPDCPGKPVVAVNPSTYLLELSAKAKPARIDAKDAAQAKDFLARYRGRDAITVHRTRHDPYRQQRHHMIHIDVPRLLGGAFDVRLRELIDSKLRGRVDTVLCPSHPGCLDLARLAATMLGISDSVVVADEEALQPESPVLARLQKSRGMVLVDDVVTTGRRLRSYKRRFQELGLSSSEREIHVLIGVGRAPSTEEIEGIADMAHHPREFFHTVERVMLPDWDESECPWCWERTCLERLNASEALPPSMERRLVRLSNDDGLGSGLFACWSDPNGDAMSLGVGSIFGEGINNAELFFSVASAFQVLREQGRLVEEFQPPIAYLLSPARYISGRFYGTSIGAAMLRAARPHDIRTARWEKTLAKKVTSAMTEPTARELRGELLLAVGQRKLPLTLSPQSIEFDGEPGLCAVLRRLLHH